MPDQESQAVCFTVDGQQHRVRVGGAADGSAGTVTASTSLADYLRDQCGLRGTKVMCRGGMCGACVVTARVPNPATGQPEVRAVNSCLALVHNCQDWQVETVQAIGDRKAGYHPAQSRLAHMDGTQCGYCSPGMVMSMYSLLESGDEVTQQSVEQHMDGNLCRCTGYRPILAAFKTFVPDADERTKQIIKDIEDVAPSGKKSGSRQACSGGGGGCAGCPRTTSLASAGAEKWSYPSSLAELCAIIKANPAEKTLKLVRGNTGTGVYKDEVEFDGYVSLLKVPELSQVTKTSSSLTMGAAVSLSRLIEELQLLAPTTGFRHFSDMASHLLVVANTPVRNAGSWAGNLMLKQSHHEFPSDVFLLLAAAGGRLQIADENGTTSEISVEQLLSEDMAKKAIVSITLSTLDETKYVYKSYKITPRAISSHAYVNAAFVLPLDSSFMITEKPTLLFGGINADFLHASMTETFLLGRPLDEETLQGALMELQSEVVPTPDPAEADPAYRRSLVTSLFYKAVLNVLGDRVPAPLRSGGDDLTRPLSSGTQQFDTDQTLWPVNKAVPKLEAQAQTAGEAKYTGDEAPEAGELYAAYVQTTVASGKVAGLDLKAALAVPGVVDFISATSIPGENNTCSTGSFKEELFTTGQVEYYGQAVGLIVAETQDAARMAAPLVNITYIDVQPPVLTIKDALKKRGAPAAATNRTATAASGKRGVRQVSGEFSIGGQYHFTMEKQTARAVPRDDDQLDVYSATQDMRDVNLVVSRLTKMPMHKINMSVRRLGGGFGSKLQHPSRVAGAAAVAAVALNRPVRLVLDIQTNMTLLGSRLPYLIQYQAEVEEQTGKISSLQMKFTADSGYSPYADSSPSALDTAPNVYRAEGWQLETDLVNTTTASNTWMRSPGTVQGVSGIECVMDHIAHEIGMDPWALRQANFFGPDTNFRSSNNRTSDYDVFMKLVSEMFSEADIDTRKAEIAQFNKDNRWRKRALSLVPVRYPLFLTARFPALISIFKDDGTVAVTTGGVEMGQGLNTKVAQVCAKMLDIPMEMISVKPNMNLVNPNGDGTGGSLGSDMCSMAAKAACEEMNKRLAPYRAAGKAWTDVITDAHDANVNLTVHQLQTPSPSYNIFALGATELELDVLTGQYRLNRVDLYEDAGQALSPALDIGQCEGAFTIGMGLHLGEEIKYDPETGRKVTDSAWNYYVPSSKDIPTDFRVKLIKNNDNPVGVFNSKATGEPPLCTTYSTISALRQAVAEARKDAGHNDWTQLDAPGTVEKAQMACGLTAEMFVLS